MALIERTVWKIDHRRNQEGGREMGLGWRDGGVGLPGEARFGRGSFCHPLHEDPPWPDWPAGAESAKALALSFLLIMSVEGRMCHFMRMGSAEKIKS